MFQDFNMPDKKSRQKIYIQRLSRFIPTETQSKPDVSFVPMLTRRRLSYLSRMVVLVSDQVSRDNDGNRLNASKVTFASQFGEITQQLKISQALIETGNVSPAHFSLSVFNASVANASILESNTAGYAATASGKDSFVSGLADCFAALENEECDTRTFIFADEPIPETYAPIAGVPYPNAVCAIALRLTTEVSKADAAFKNVDVANLFEQFKTRQDHYDTAAEQALAFLRELDSQKE